MIKHTIANCLQKSSQLTAVSDTPRLDLEIILAHTLKKSRTHLFAWPEKELTAEQQQQFDHFFSRRLAGEPIAHIIGTREFWSLEFMVNNTTLIPRPDTELLVETVLDLFAQDQKNNARRLLDLGTGTGAIVLALAHEKTHWQCTGVDKEIAAVQLAEKNRVHLQLCNVKIMQSDWFTQITAAEKFDVIVSNPPYINPNDKHLAEGDVRFEPRSALIANNKGLADLEFIIVHAKSYLAANGYLLVEHGCDQAEKVREFFTNNYFLNIKTLRDLGGNERVTFGKHMEDKQ
jgi:release factor glutamine methyltransferase